MSDYEIHQGVDIRFGSLFSGIGGFDLGFERAGMTCAWQYEIDAAVIVRGLVECGYGVAWLEVRP